MTLYLPPGFQFHPTHLELVLYYLLNKVLGDKLPSDAVIEGEVYGDEARLPEAHDIGNRELHWLVKIKKNQNGTKTKRKTKNGYWKVTGNKKKIKDESGNHIGTMRSLVLVDTNKSGRKKKLLMDEYTLDGSLKKRNSEGWVLCKIKQSNRSPERPYSQEEEEEEGDGLTSRPTASPALQGIDNISNSLVIDAMECFDMDNLLASTEDNPATAQCPSEPAGGPSHMWLDQSFDQSWATMGTPTLTPTEPPTLGDDWENYNWENIYNECLDNINYPESQPMAECPFEPAGGPSHICPVQWFDQSWARMGTPTLTPTEPPTLVGIDYNCENDDGWANIIARTLSMSAWTAHMNDPESQT